MHDRHIALRLAVCVCVGGGQLGRLHVRDRLVRDQSSGSTLHLLILTCAFASASTASSCCTRALISAETGAKPGVAIAAERK